MSLIRRLAWPAVLFTGGMVFYGLTLVRGVQPADSGEFQWVGTTLGLAHPPGFGLYTLLAHLFSRGPFSTPAAGISWLSSVFSAFTLAIVYQITADLIQKAGSRVSAAAGATAALALATSTTFWSQATTANIRSLTILMTALAFWGMVRLYFLPGDHNHHSIWLNPLTGFTLAIGLGVTHHLSLVFIGLIMVPAALWWGKKLLHQPAQWAALAIASTAAFLPWLYLPLQEPGLRRWGPFWEYALGLGFRGDFFYFNSPLEMWDRLGVMGNIFLFQFSPLLLTFAAAGWLLLLRRRPRIAALLGAAFGVHTFVTASYRAPQAVEYLMPAYLPIAICLGYGTAILFDEVRSRSESRWWRPVSWALPVIVAGAAVLQGFERFPSFAWLSRSTDTQDYVNEIWGATPQNGVVLADWHWYTPLRYTQTVSGARPDVAVEFVFPQTADYGADWAGAIKRALEEGRPVVATHIDPDAYVNLPLSKPVGEALLFAPADLMPELLAEAGAPTSLGPRTALTGWHTHTDPAQNISVILQLEVAEGPAGSDRVFVQLRDLDGRPVAVGDEPLPVGAVGEVVLRFELAPWVGTPPGTYRVVAGGYDSLQPDETNETFLEEIDLEGEIWPPVTQNPVQWEGDADGRTLIGYDWDHTLPDQARLYLHWRLPNGRYWSQTVDLPPGDPFTLTLGEDGPQTITPNLDTHYVPFSRGIVWLGNGRPLADQNTAPGSTVITSQLFAAGRPVQRDIGFAVRLIGLEDDGKTWAWLSPEPDFDIPALGAIPTLKWIQGSRIDHPRRLSIPTTASPNQLIEGFLRPYEVMTNRPLAILDDRIVNSGRQWVPFD